MSAVFSGYVSFKSDGYLAEKCPVSIIFYKVIHFLCYSCLARLGRV